MEFEIIGNSVVISNSTLRPIQQINLDGCTFLSIIKRFKSNRKKGENNLGDNCPMLYAMKGLNGLTADPITISQVFNYCNLALINHFNNQPQCFDAIIVIPSQHNIGLELAKMVQRHTSIQTPIYDQLLVKNTVSNAIETVLQNKNIPQNIKDSIKTSLSRNRSKLELKSVSIEYRQYVPMLKISNAQIAQMNMQNILLVDDIISSGATLNNAEDLLRDRFPSIKTVSVLTLFGALSARHIRRTK